MGEIRFLYTTSRVRQTDILSEHSTLASCFSMHYRLTDLPAEALAKILKILPKPDLKSVRLCSTRLSAIAASMLFDRVYFAPRKFEMERFRNIAQHPLFSKNIKELVYDGRLYCEEYRNLELYTEMIYWQKCDGQPGDDKNRVKPYLDPLDLEHYSSCVDEQEYILNEKTDYDALLAGLEQMPIRRLTVQGEFKENEWRVSIHNTEHLWYRTMSDLSFYSRHDERDDLPSPVFSPSSWSECRKWLPWESRFPRNRRWDCRGLAHLFTAVSERCHNIDELHIGTENSLVPMNLFHPSNGIINHIDRLAPRLACLKLASKQYETDIREDIGVALSRLTNLMQQAKQLRTLSLSINTDEQQSRRIFDGWGTWSHLSLLDLGHFRTFEDDLAAAVVSQKDSLTELGIRCIELEVPGSWERLGDEIGRCLRLCKITIDDLYKDVANDPMDDDDWVYRGLPFHVQERVAKLIMQWVSSDMLELIRDHQGHYCALFASVKPEAKDVKTV